MPEIFRTRDVVVLAKDMAIPVAVSDNMLVTGWPGGQGAKWIDSPLDEFKVDYSDGLYGGFLLWGSDESSDQYVSSWRQQIKYGYAILCAGNWVIMTSTYERYTWNSRHGIGPPNVSILYQPGQRCVFSLRGYFTTEDEWHISGDPRGDNGYFIANVVQVPTAATNWFITLQTSI